MAVKILIKRTVSKNKVEKMKPLFVEMRTLAMRQQGYISGETLKSLERSETFMVISTWLSPTHWEKWMLSLERNKIQQQMDPLLEGKTEYELFHLGIDDKDVTADQKFI